MKYLCKYTHKRSTGGGGAGSGNTGDRMGDFSFLYILSYVVITFSAGEIPSIIFPMSIPELQRTAESSSPFQTPSKLGIDDKVLPSGCFHETEWKMEVGECHLPALWGCSCGQARPWVLRGNDGEVVPTGHCSRAQAPAMRQLRWLQRLPDLTCWYLDHSCTGVF